MNYSPFIVPVVALVIWFQLLMYAAVITKFRRLSVSQSPTAEDKEVMREEAGRYIGKEPVLFCVVCIILASVDAGSEMAAWLAWIYAASCALATLPRVSENLFASRGTWIVSNLILCALIIYAAVRVARDLLTAFG